MFGIFATFPAEFGLVVEATDPAAAAQSVAGLVQGLDRLLVTAAAGNEDFEVSFDEATIGGTDVSVITLTSNEVPWPIELLIGSNDDIMVLGTRASVTTILLQDGTLPNTPAFARAQTYTLPAFFSMSYFDPAALLPLADLITATAEDQNEAEAEMQAEAVRALLNLIDSISYSGAFDNEGVANVRVSITLAE
jgi:hypothetical protein